MASSSVLVSILFLVVACSASNYNKAQGGGGEGEGRRRIKEQYQNCNSSSCGNLLNISYPFRLKDDSKSCGDHRYELSCENNRAVLYLFAGKYYVKSISYENLTIQVVDSGLQEHNCSTLPIHSLIDSNFTRKDPYRLNGLKVLIILENCSEIPSNSSLYVNAAPCINGTSETRRNYVILGESVEDLQQFSCSIRLMVTTTLQEDVSYRSFSEIHRHVLLVGVELSWSKFDDCTYWPPNSIQCLRVRYVLLGVAVDASLLIALIMAARAPCGFICLSAFLIYKFRRRHLSMDDTIEDFLQSHSNLVPIRYSYSQIKKITKGFNNKLGQGGYGSVFKGKLRSGRLVAVKVLGKAKANGQEFINEVATIGRIHHINVVRLTGFCVEGSKRALIYDLMPNGSLEKYIFSHGKEGISLSWEKMYDIALGVARGIEYLHRGCDMQILHFDIKPHNILLDKNFVPKVSDFGLAKLYPADDSIVSLTAARGTMGYIAPELFYKNIGGVSYKADVYSYGMLLMEMVGRRKSVNPFVENSSQIYFPDWIYERFNRGDQEIDIADGGDEDEKMIVRKLILIALWCIQMNPIDRPSMGKVIEMLEGPIELLQLAPKPLLFPQENLGLNNDNATTNSTANPSKPSFDNELELVSITSLESIPLKLSVG